MRVNFGPLLRELASLFESGAHPALTQAAPQVVEPLKQAAAALDEALPAVADEMANAALAKVPAGALATPFADELINDAIARLQAKLSAQLPQPMLAQGVTAKAA